MKLVPTALTLCAVSLLARGAIAADAPPADEPPKIYQCTDADGNVAYQDDPCKAVPPAPKVKAAAKPKPEAKPPAKKPAAVAKPKIERQLVAMIKPRTATESRPGALP